MGKSETAIELVKRGHRLIADDVVEIRRVSDTTPLGTAPISGISWKSGDRDTGC